MHVYLLFTIARQNNILELYITGSIFHKYVWNCQHKQPISTSCLECIIMYIRTATRLIVDVFFSKQLARMWNRKTLRLWHRIFQLLLLKFLTVKISNGFIRVIWCIFYTKWMFPMNLFLPVNFACFCLPLI